MTIHRLLLVEGDTEVEFFTRLAETYFPNCPKTLRNLHGNFNINRKIIEQALRFAERKPNQSFSLCICIDQERIDRPAINVDIIRTALDEHYISCEIVPIIAVLMTESLWFADIDGIYAHLRAPHNARNPKKYANFRTLTHLDLSKLFRQHGNTYVKGRRTKNFIANLDLARIVSQCDELRRLIAHCAK